MTYILRDYIEKRFGLHAMESTSDEILDHLQAMRLPETIISELALILELSDKAKFAKSRPLPHENTQAMHDAIHFIESTKPVEQDAEKIS
jgi:hypothetical protein